MVTRQRVLKEALAYYDKLLEDKELARSSLRLLDEKLHEAGLIFGGRKLTPYLRPHFVTESDWKRISKICETIFGSLQKVKDAAVGSEELLDELGVTETEKDLVSIDPKYTQAAPTSRLDSFLTEDTFSYVELNGESPAGIAFSDSARDIFFQMPLMKAFMETYEVRGLEGRPKLLDTLLKCYEEFSGGNPKKDPLIAIVDLKDLPTVEEFRLCRDYFIANGCRSMICSPDELEFSDEKLSCRGEVIDIVYRRLLVREYLPIVDEFPDLLDAYRAGAVCVANSYRALLLHKKAMFAVLTNEKYGYLFTDEELSAIKAHIPWTRNFGKEKTLHYDEEIDLVSWTRANAHRLVLKPNDDYGGKGIYIGWTLTEDEWDEAIDRALSVGDYLVQERVKTAKEIFPYIDDEGKVQMLEQMVDLDPLLFNGKVGSAFTRLSTTELANVSSGGGMVPTLILKGK